MATTFRSILDQLLNIRHFNGFTLSQSPDYYGFESM